GLEAVSRTVGSVGHDRVQSGGRVLSVAHQIAHWYRLTRTNIERIEFDDSFDRDSFVIRPSYVKFFGRRHKQTIYPDSLPLTLIPGHRSRALTAHIRGSALSAQCRAWVERQIAQMVAEHQRASPAVDERDLLRASGALSKLGINLGMYRRSGIDCPDATFTLNRLPEYSCPVEVEERSSGLLAAHHAPHRRQRLVLLCMFHDAHEVLRGYVDVLELRELGRVLGEVA
ncbi:MAG: hypothetical protein ACRD2A_12475, partial [Vicinamibacterales bacterium]